MFDVAGARAFADGAIFSSFRRSAIALGKRDETLSFAPHAEQRERKLNWVDRKILEMTGTVICRIPFGQKNLEWFSDRVLAEWETIRRYDDRELAAESVRLRPHLRRGPLSHDLVVRAFALVREATDRKLGMRHHPVQLQGGFVMLRGGLAEMATGEGKTITALLPAIVGALAGMPVHVITVNDYLAERDMTMLRPVYEMLGIKVGLVVHEMESNERREAYCADVVYVTNKELVFDYLRDRIATGSRRGLSRSLLDGLFESAGRRSARPPLLLRGLHFGIIDEADSILIDEARTPLIISSESEADEDDVYRIALETARELRAVRDYRIGAHDRSVELTDQGRKTLETLSVGRNGLWRIRKARDELATQALSALYLFDLNRHYIIADDKVQIVDEYTGRTMADRSWEGGLHQMIEMKEGLAQTGQRRTIARITYQRFFRRYRHLAGMTGTASEVAGELYAQFSLKTQRIPTNRPLLRRHLGTRVFASEMEKWRAVTQRVREVAQGEGRPVLVGTKSVEASEALSAAMTGAGIGHVVLNARQDREEAAIIAAAGRRGRVTVATNIAGRGTDVLLENGVAGLGGLHVILTEFHESSRIDRQLFGRAGRQGDPGSCEAMVSLEDDVFVRFAPSFLAAARLVRRGSELPAPQLFGEIGRLIAQGWAEMQHAATRRAQINLDYQLDKALSFAGVSE
jgi:preprotein translocase subunit SecA